MDTQGSNPNESPERLPDAVRARLAAVDRTAPPAAADVDADVDAAVLAAARAHFAARRPESPGSRVRPFRRRPWRRFRDAASPRRTRPDAGRSTRWAAGAAAAAMLLAALLVVRPLGLLTSYDPDDIDRSGRVDILDAFALARMRADGAPISEMQIDEIAARVVALEPRGAAR